MLHFFQANDARIIIGGFYQDMALKVFCEVRTLVMLLQQP